MGSGHLLPKGHKSDGSTQLYAREEQIARILAHDHSKFWTPDRIAEHFGISKGNAAGKMYSERVQMRAYFLSRQKLKQLAYKAIDVLSELLDTAENESVRMRVAQDILDRAGFNQVETPKSMSAFNLVIDLSGKLESRVIDQEADDGEEEGDVVRETEIERDQAPGRVATKGKSGGQERSGILQRKA